LGMLLQECLLIFRLVAVRAAVLVAARRRALVH
jgi:hypothetical protein